MSSRRHKSALVTALVSASLVLVTGLAVPSASGQSALSGSGSGFAAVDSGIARALDSIESAKQRRQRVEAEIEGLADRRQAARERMHKRARALYRMTRAGMLPLAGGFDALLRHLGRVERLERMVRQDIEAVRSLRQRRKALRDQRKTLKEKLGKARRRLAELRAKKRTLQTSSRSGGFKEAFRGSDFKPGTRWQAPGGSVRLSGSAPSPTNGFESKRGALRMPISGTFEMRNARHGDGQGLAFVTEPGTPVRTVAQGEVAFSDRHEPYGRLVIVDHGNEYYTVYGGLGHIDAQLGDYVGRGARIGTVGADRDPAALIFEVRKGTRTRDPRAWLGI